MLATSLIEEFLCVPKYHLAVRDFCTRDICLYTANTELSVVEVISYIFLFSEGGIFTSYQDYCREMC